MEPTSVTGSGQYLSFTLADEEYAVDISRVREVLDYTTVTAVPRMPDYMRGVINLRGSVLPVVDLRAKFGMGPTGRTLNTCIVIVEVEMGGELVRMGALADSVQEVLDLDARQIEPPPRIGPGIDVDFIRGMGRRDDKFIIILDIDRVLSDEEAGQLQQARAA